MKHKVVFGEDFIQILRGGKEVVYWGKQEWVADPEIVFSIANAVKKAAEGTLGGCDACHRLLCLCIPLNDALYRGAIDLTNSHPNKNNKSGFLT